MSTSNPHRLSTSAQRLILRELATLLDEHAARTAEAEALFESTSRRIELEHDEANAAAEAQRVRTMRSIDAELRNVLNRLESTSAERIAAIEHRFATELRDFIAGTNRIESQARARFEERKWLAETMLESANKRVRQEFDAIRLACENRRRDLNAIEARASELLARGRHAPLPQATPDTLTGEAVSASEAGMRRSSTLLETLERASHPFVLNAGFVVGSILAAAACGGIAMSLSASPASASGEIARSVGAAAGASAVAALVVFVARRFALRARVPAEAKRLAETLASAAHACELALADLAARKESIVEAAKAAREKELVEAEAEIRAADDVVATRRTTEEPAIRAGRDRAVAEAKTSAALEIRSVERSAAEHRATAEDRRTAATADALHARGLALRAAATARREAAGIEAERWNATVARLGEAVRDMRTASRLACPRWEPDLWSGFSDRTTVPEAIPLGEYVVSCGAMPGGVPRDQTLRASLEAQFEQGVVALPLLLDLRERGSLLLQHGPEARAEAIAALNNAMLRLMTTIPPAKARFTIIDPVGLGQSFAAFTHLADLDEQLINDRVWTDPRHIEQRLAELTEHMETVIQKYLRNEYATIGEYNAMAGEVAEPLRFLVIADFPANLSEQAAKRLASIITSGPRCGVLTLVAHDARARIESWLPLADLQKSSLWLRHEQGRWVRQDEELKRWPLTLEAPADETLATALLRQVGTRSKELGKVRVPFEITAPATEQAVWSLSSKDEVRVPLGRSGATKIQHMTLGQGTAQHALIAGRTGSGKSTLLHVIITNLALWYGPDEIEMYLVDFKKGVEFKAYAAHELPHARVIAVESEREFGLSVLRRLDAELTRRGQLFRDRNVQDVAGWRRTTGEAMPRVMFIVDEFQEFFVEDDKLAQEASLLLDRLVRQGRAFGMHVVLGSQTLGGAYSLARSTLGQMAVRVALQCSEADSYLIMSEDNPAPRLLSRPGEAIYNDASGLVEGNSPFQIVWLPEQTRDAMLDKVRARDGAALTRQRIVFEGNLPAEIRRNHLLASLRDRSRMPSGPVTAWLGEAISIKDPTSMTFRRQAAANLLIVGQQEDAAATMMLAAATSIEADGRGRLVVLDSTPADAPEYGRLEKPAMRQVAEGLPRWSGPRASAATISLVADEVARRETLASDPDGKVPEDSVFVLIMGLHRLRDLRKVDDFSFGSDEGGAKPDKQLAKVLRDGPAVGVHVIAWVDTAASLDRTLERATAREFEARVLFQMSANDSTNLIDTPAASTLGRNRALLHREELGTIEKFRPYAPFDDSST